VEVAAPDVPALVAPFVLHEAVEVAAPDVPALVAPFVLHEAVETVAPDVPALVVPFGLHEAVEAAAPDVPALVVPFVLHEAVEAAAPAKAVAEPLVVRGLFCHVRSLAALAPRSNQNEIAQRERIRTRLQTASFPPAGGILRAASECGSGLVGR
jgi:hypothetical protein